MPFVNIKITKDGATPEQKAELIKGVTDLLVKVLHKNPATTVVVIEEVDTDNWGIGGQTVTAIRRESKVGCVSRTRKVARENTPYGRTGETPVPPSHCLALLVDDFAEKTRLPRIE